MPLFSNCKKIFRKIFIKKVIKIIQKLIIKQLKAKDIISLFFYILKGLFIKIIYTLINFELQLKVFITYIIMYITLKIVIIKLTVK